MWPDAASITDPMCEAVYAQMPHAWVKTLLDGALTAAEPHRNHSRHRLAELWRGLVCPHCTPTEEPVNHVTGCIFVGWGHGWQPCQRCGGSGLAATVDGHEVPLYCERCGKRRDSRVCPECEHDHGNEHEGPRCAGCGDPCDTRVCPECEHDHGHHGHGDRRS